MDEEKIPPKPAIPLKFEFKPFDVSYHNNIEKFKTSALKPFEFL